MSHLAKYVAGFNLTLFIVGAARWRDADGARVGAALLIASATLLDILVLWWT